jgi:hypothetical protein
MKRVIAFTVALVVASSGAAFAQTISQTVSLAEVARKEEARRKTAKKAIKVFTNSSLTPSDAAEVSASPSPAPAASGATNATAGVPTTIIPGGKAEPVDPAAMKDQAYWQGRISKARTDLSRTRLFADSLQTRINSLNTDWINRDNRVEKEKIKQDLDTALAELERVKKEIDAQTKAITAIEDEARRANVPSGWLRPSV